VRGLASSSYLISPIPCATSEPMTLDSGAFDRYRETFLERMGDFVDFSLESGTYWTEEREYKVELVSVAREALSPEVFSESGKGLVGRVQTGLKRVLTGRLKSIGRPQNLLGWRYIDVLMTLPPSPAQKFANALGELLYSTDPIPRRIDAFTKLTWPIFSGGEKGNPYALARIVPSLFLMLSDPKGNIAVRTDLFRAAGDDLIGRRLLVREPFSGKEYEAVREFSSLVFSNLERLGWIPNDMLDVHSFLWIATRATYNEELFNAEAET
jgi:hypothetical protein